MLKSTSRATVVNTKSRSHLPKFRHRSCIAFVLVTRPVRLSPIEPLYTLNPTGRRPQAQPLINHVLCTSNCVLRTIFRKHLSRLLRQYPDRVAFLHWPPALPGALVELDYGLSQSPGFSLEKSHAGDAHLGPLRPTPR